MENLHLLLYKSYYNELHYGDNGLYFNELVNVNAIQKKIVDAKFYKQDYIEANPAVNARILLKCCYPGLTAGLGYSHIKPKESDDEEDQYSGFIDNGFSLDPVSGQPYLPGSSIKGVLRSKFAYPDVIRELLGEQGDNIDVAALEKEIFEGGKDEFFDAVICCGTKGDYILNIDNITPHIDNTTPHKGEIQSPQIHTILRVRPGVVFEFRFCLNDGQIIDKKQKRELFRKLLKEFGAGAKTNVGYGVLAELTKQENYKAQSDPNRLPVHQDVPQNLTPEPDPNPQPPQPEEHRPPQVDDIVKIKASRVVGMNVQIVFCDPQHATEGLTLNPVSKFDFPKPFTLERVYCARVTNVEEQNYTITMKGVPQQ